MIVALIGNQNCGKTALFNQLTGLNQHVGNFPGVTVESKMGEIKGVKEQSTVVDLPGIYSLSPYTEEEIVTRDYALSGKADVIINILDATNIERNLYLTMQLMQLRVPMILALNMMDELQNNGGSIDVVGMEKELGIPIVPITAINGQGVSELLSRTEYIAKRKILPKKEDICEGACHRCIHSIAHTIEDHAERIAIPDRFAAIKLIEGDKPVSDALDLSENEKELIEHLIKELEDEGGLERYEAIASMRYTFIESLCAKYVKKPNESKEQIRSRKMDKILTHKIWGLPIFFGIMFLVFWLTFGVIGSYLSDLLALGIDGLTELVKNLLIKGGINEVVRSLVIDGVFAGVGSVLSFLPIIVVLFFFLSMLEDSGYMTRVAFIMDKLLRKIGLSGKSFVPMLIGFGCTVPAVMSARTLSGERDRKMTIMLVPYCSCSAKLPIYTTICYAFFREYAALVMISLYVLGIIVGILFALLLKNTKFKGEPIPFVMELPNYRIPSLKTTTVLMWEKAKDFLQRAFTVIFVSTIIIWFLQSFDFRLNPILDSNNANSILAHLGKYLAPLFTPVGFGSWQAITALITGFIAEEAVISTLTVLIGGADLTLALTTFFTPLSALAFLVFTLLYTPCIAATRTIRNELRSTKETTFLIISQILIAYLGALIVYQVGGLFI
ncbi:MAG: ferrous iron transport protein B [Clostridia bacterium]|nr:ferrous iron transport protein B [Clostridia bacterium]